MRLKNRQIPWLHIFSVMSLKTSSLKVTSLIFHSCTCYDWTSEAKEGSEEAVCTCAQNE